MKIVRYGTNGLATLAIGFLLSRYVSNLPYDFPPLPASIAFAMRALHIDTVKNADDIETIGLVIIIVASLIVAALLVWALNRLLRHRQTAHRS
ncbi:MAG: hypothetical protein EPN57_03150 [Paraburkholderia sp.]|nr:MAG: hypothetical protein EPN57_03150 [Paraburkholderia sp.]